MRRVSLEKVRNERERWLTPTEDTRLLTHSVPWLQDILVFALNTGMRRGEILGLEWRAVDLSRQVLVVMKSKIWREAHSAAEQLPCGTSTPQDSDQRETLLRVYDFLWDQD